MDDKTKSLLPKIWQNFLAKLALCESLPIEEWNANQLIGWFAKRYHDHYDKNFALSYKGAPSKSTEMFFMKRTMAMLGTTEPRLVKSYIDWIFEFKVKPQKLNIRSMGLLATTNFVNEFLISRAKKEKITRSTELPNHLLEIASGVAKTYGDLAFIKMAIDEEPDVVTTYSTLFNKLIANGFKPDILKSL